MVGVGSDGLQIAVGVSCDCSEAASGFQREVDHGEFGANINVSTTQAFGQCALNVEAGAVAAGVQDSRL